MIRAMLTKTVLTRAILPGEVLETTLSTRESPVQGGCQVLGVIGNLQWKEGRMMIGKRLTLSDRKYELQLEHNRRWEGGVTVNSAK